MPITANGKTDRNAIDKLRIPELQFSSEAGCLTHNLTSPEQALKDIWQEVLSNRTAQLLGTKYQQRKMSPNSDFFQIRGSSILMIKLKALIEIQFGVIISMPELFHASTLHSMAALIEGLSKPTVDSVETTASFLTPNGAQAKIDWDLKIASLVDGLQPPYSVSSLDRPSNHNEGLIVVLTGATGFIGRHLLSNLVHDPRVAQVHCLAIRSDTDGKPRHVSAKSDKIIEYIGDLPTANLGLSDSEFTYLMNNANCIIHNGADVSLLKTYHSLRRANVLCTRTLCQMATPHCVPLHYISTASVAKAIEHNGNQPLYEVPAFPADHELLNSIDGYAASNWVSEMLIDKNGSG